MVVLDPDLRVQREALPIGAQLTRNESGLFAGLDTETSDGSTGLGTKRDAALDRRGGDHRQEKVIGVVRRNVSVFGKVTTAAQSVEDAIMQNARESEHVRVA